MVPEGDRANAALGRTFFVLTAITILLASCAPHRTHLPTQSAPAHSMQWIDLQPGWRVRVVTPIVKSGGYLPRLEPMARNATSQENAQSPRGSAGPAVLPLKTGKGFMGFEVSMYRVKARRGGGIHVAFVSAVINRRGKKISARYPILPLFRLPRNDRFVRVLHLAWTIQGSHDAAILAAKRRGSLDVFSRKVEFHPSACVDSPEASCSWVPAGVAVIPEYKKHLNGKMRWTAAM